MNSEIKHTQKIPTKRVFFALWPGAGLSRQMFELASRVGQAAGGRVQKQENIHLTLRFIGAVDADTERALVTKAAGIRLPRLTLTLDSLGFWPRPKVVWLAPSVTPAPLAQLAARLEALCVECGIEAEKRPFAPHITLLRKARQPRRMPAFDPLEWPVHDFVLARSETRPEGACYTVLHRWPLRE